VNILYVNHNAGSPALGMEYRPYYLAREWVRLGHKVQMLAGDFSHVRTKQPSRGDEVIDGIHYRWYPTSSYEGNGVGRVRNVWAFLRAVWADTPRLLREFRPDVVIASSTYPMDIWVARRLARRAGAQLVYEVHDLWPLSPIELNGMSPHHPFIMLCQAAEDAAYRDADVVVSLLPKVQAHMRSHGLDLKKLKIVPNGITTDEWEGEPTSLRADMAQALTAGGTVVGYAGSMGRMNELDTLLDAAVLLRDEPLRFVLVGNGPDRARLAQRVSDEHLSNVTMLAPISKAQIPAFLAGVDIGYNGYRRLPIYRFGIAPNKTLDYMMARCVVLQSVEAGNDLVLEADCGLTVAPEDAAAVAGGLRSLAALTPAQRLAMGERGRAFVLANHTYPVLAKRFLEALA